VFGSTLPLVVVPTFLPPHILPTACHTHRREHTLRMMRTLPLHYFGTDLLFLQHTVLPCILRSTLPHIRFLMLQYWRVERCGTFFSPPPHATPRLARLAYFPVYKDFFRGIRDVVAFALFTGGF